VDAAGNVYVSDMGVDLGAASNRIQKFDSAGNFLLKWGSQGSTDGLFIAPVGLAIDTVGNVFVCDLGNRLIQKFDSSGNFLAKFGGVGVGGGTFGWPVGVAVNSSGHILVTDWTNSLVQEFAPAF
jgi:DNA-binding beta-propeller fold protein YncE